MSYTAHEWQTGETITAAKMNNIEEGIQEAAQSGGGGSLICTCEYSSALNDYVLDKTVQEIYDAFMSGTPVYIKYQYGTLGPSGSGGSYISHTYLAPVVKVYGYAYTDVIRIVASWASMLSNSPSSGTGDLLHSDSVVLFSATSLSDYPVVYRTVFPNPSSLSAFNGL